jgi:hypothetical protein
MLAGFMPGLAASLRLPYLLDLSTLPLSLSAAPDGLQCRTASKQATSLPERLMGTEQASGTRSIRLPLLTLYPIGLL